MTTMSRWSRPLLVAGCVALLLEVAGISVYGEDARLETPTWSSLHQQAHPSPTESFSSLDQNRAVFRQAPALTGRFQVNDQTLIPFIGAGFGGGYTTDRDRALGSNGLFHNPAQSGELGKNMMPNEFNLGLRIPF